MFFVVTGSEGFLGRAVVARLAADGHDVIAVDRIARAGEPLKHVVYHQSDITEPATLIPSSLQPLTLSPFPPFTIIHLAWDMRRFDGFGLQAAQVNMMASLLDYWSTRGLQKVIVMGSAEEYGARAGCLREIDLPQFPLSPYGWSKRSARDLLESWSARTGIAAIWLRPFIMYGPGQKGDQLIPAAIAAARSRTKTAFTDGRQLRDFVYVDDVVDAIRRAVNASLTGFQSFNLGSGATPVADVINAIARACDASACFDLGARPRRPGEPDVQFADTAHAQSILGWQPRVGWHDGIMQTVAAR